MHRITKSTVSGGKWIDSRQLLKTCHLLQLLIMSCRNFPSLRFMAISLSVFHSRQRLQSLLLQPHWSSGKPLFWPSVSHPVPLR